MIKPINLNIKCFSKGIFFLLFLPFFSNAQHYNFKNLSIENGLQSSFVYSSIEDDKGYIWFATEKGLSRYDGINFEYFGEKDGLTENGFYQITKDKEGVLWFVSKKFKIFYYKNSKFNKLNTNEKICWIDIDKSNKKWFLTRSGDILSLDSSFRIIMYFVSKQKDIFYYNLKNTGNNEFVLCNDNELFILKKNFNKVKIEISTSVINSHVVTRFFLKKDNSLLISNVNGIYSLKDKQLKFEYPLKENQVYSFYEDELNNDVWFGTLKGAYLFKKGKIIETNKQVYLKENIILNIRKQVEGSMWFCSSENGVYNSNTMAFHYDEVDGLKKKTVSFIRKDGSDIYAISFDGKISILKNNKVLDFPLIMPKEFSSKRLPVYEFFQTKQDGVFIFLGDLYQIKNRKIEKYFKSGFSQNYYPFFQNDLEFLHTISRLGPLKATNRKESLLNYAHIYNNIKKFVPENAPIFFENLDSLCLLYIVSKDGLIEVKIKNTDYSYKTIHFPYNIKDVYKTEKGNLIIGTLDKGLCVIKNNRRTFYTTEDGLLSDYCTKTYFINNRIWICSNKGVSRLLLDKNDSVVSISNFTSNDLLIYNEVNDLLIHDGQVYVATNKGVSVFPEDIQLQSNKPKVFIENIQINNKTQSILNEYQLEHTENNISIQYKSISFRSANNIFYKYKLVGSSNSNFVMTKLDRIQLSSLSPGTYTFMVWARNIDGVWSSQPAKIVFVIHPPFWQKAWFVLLMIGIVSVLIFIYIRIRLRNFKIKNETAKRIIDAELKAIRLHMNPHFIFNTLSSLQYYIVYNKNKEAGKYLATFSLLLRLIMQYSRQNEIYLKDEVELLNKYVELEQMRFENKIDYTLKVEEGLLYYMIPPLILQPFVENAIKYGISNIEGRGKLLVSIMKDENFLSCSIQDNGIGRAKSESLKNDKNLRFESTGIAYTRERLRLLSNQENGDNLVTVTDLYENDLACGTLVEIRIPIN